MSIEIKVPPLGESVTEATVAKWYKNIGENVAVDDLLVELETDKVTLEVNATATGSLSEIKVQEGDTVSIGDILGFITQGAAAVTSEQPIISSKPVDLGTQSKTNLATASTSSSKILSPAAGKIARENNLDTSTISGSGKAGRITKGDALQAMTSTKSESMVPRENRVKMSKLRQMIAKRLKDSQNTAAILTTFNEVDMTNIMRIRSVYKEKFQEKHGIKLGFMSFFVKACIAALKEIPAVNAQIEDDHMIYKNYYDIGVAVGTEQGLVVPVVRDADTMSFAGVEKEIYNFGVKARDGKLSIADLTGGTFTISNGGVYGSLLSTPIINPPQSAILGMHKTQPRPVVIDGKVEIRPMMYLALSYDHRIIDGKEAVTFLVKVKEAIEDPERLLFDI